METGVGSMTINYKICTNSAKKKWLDTTETDEVDCSQPKAGMWRAWAGNEEKKKYHVTEIEILAAKRKKYHYKVGIPIADNFTTQVFDFYLGS